jgi:hypothetical protein
MTQLARTESENCHAAGEPWVFVVLMFFDYLMLARLETVSKTFEQIWIF